MDRSTMETVSAAYTVYSLLCPNDKVVVSIDSFVEIFKSNFAFLDTEKNGVIRSNGDNGPTERRFSEEEVEKTLEKGMKTAEEMLDDKEKQEAFLAKVKNRMKTIPMVGNVLSNVPIMFKLVNSYFKEEYTDIPRKQLLITVSALTYLIAPIDLIPDFIPVVGFLDDMAVVSACIKLTKPELDKYLAWRENAQVKPEENNQTSPDEGEHNE